MTLNGRSTHTDYTYARLPSPRVGETVLQTTQILSTSFDTVRKVIVEESSLLNGQSLLSRDDNDVQIRTTYDVLGRVLSETVAPDDPDYEATRCYSYFLVPQPQPTNARQKAAQLLTDVKQVQTRTEFDGLNRPVYEERQDVDNPSRAGAFRQTYAAEYDVLGQLINETEYDWLEDQDLALTTHFGYDDWGQQRSETAPEGVITVSETDPIGTTLLPVKREWQQTDAAASDKYNYTVSEMNLFEKPQKVERLTRRGQAVSEQLYHYDGLGRTVEEIDALGRSTLYGYDVFDRMVETTLPGSPVAVVKREYALHSSDDLPIRISVNDRTLGEQAFDGLGRMYSATTGGREQTFTFDPGQSQPKSLSTASGQLIEYVYKPQLSEEPLQRRIVGSSVSADYVYDRHNARLLHCEESGQELNRTYFSTGELKSEERKQGSERYSMLYGYSRQGRLLSYTDVLSQVQDYQYDEFGRLETTSLGTTTSTFSYNRLGLTERIETSDSQSGQHVTVSLEYDDFGREVLRSFDLDGALQTLTQTYNLVDGLEQRILREGATLLRDETYGYDARDRLQSYTCSGSQPPIDPYGKAIISQAFRFDAMDNLTQVLTSFDGGSNTARYTYDDVDPVQLRKVVNSHGDYPQSIDLEYNADGHLILDEEGRTLDYDALGRLTQVSGGGASGGYHYDPLDKLYSKDGTTGAEQRFYQEGGLSTLRRGGRSSSFMRGDDNLLAQRQGGSDPVVLLACDASNSVGSELEGGAANAIAYTAYGYPSAARPVSCQLGFNGELTEANTGWQLLGSGYRAYNPVLMRFHSPDSMSPFGQGGLNTYCYVTSPPNERDPTGHFGIPRFLKNLGGNIKRWLGLSKKTTNVAGLGVTGNFVELGQGLSDLQKKVSKNATFAAGADGLPDVYVTRFSSSGSSVKSSRSSLMSESSSGLSKSDPSSILSNEEKVGRWLKSLPKKKLLVPANRVQDPRIIYSKQLEAAMAALPSQRKVASGASELRVIKDEERYAQLSIEMKKYRRIGDQDYHAKLSAQRDALVRLVRQS
ncbi:RHS repeat domain-containing protein [Pseudomonas batumici]|uniref:RHS repeat domain-containing protein n=1 Tax=Pseudomonas batumici TaxID=226910 RepID=UPI001427DE5B|nr:RHS repeat-associated core domain-containing protein [Pseudomonas batumici]